jgi:hypothetical protein
LAAVIAKGEGQSFVAGLTTWCSSHRVFDGMPTATMQELVNSFAEPVLNENLAIMSLTWFEHAQSVCLSPFQGMLVLGFCT